MSSRCAECDRFMEWPLQCGPCRTWFCDVCHPRSSHDCCGDDEPDDDWDEYDEASE